jgi:hypothetical protein
MGTGVLIALGTLGLLLLLVVWWVSRMLARLQPAEAEAAPIEDETFLLVSLAWDAYVAARAREGRTAEPTEAAEIAVNTTRQQVTITFRPRLPHENDAALWNSLLASGDGVTPPSRLKREATRK